MISSSKVSFTEISSSLLSLCDILNKKLELKKYDYPYYMKGRSAKVIIDGKEVGTIGELSPNVLLNNSYTNPVCCFEIEI
jgi:phenylalanyl-tRNA synthetase beta chain